MIGGVYTNITRALDQALIDGAPEGWQVLRRGRVAKFGDKPWLHGELILGRPFGVAFGQGRYSRVNGIYQITLFYPRTLAESSVGQIYATADALIGHFYPADGQGRVITAGPNEIIVDQHPAIGVLTEDSEPALGSQGGVRGQPYVWLNVDVNLYVDLPPGV